MGIEIRRASLLLAVLLALPAARAVLAAEDAPDFPSTADIEKLVDGKQYAPALRQLQRVLALSGAAANPYDRYKLLMMRAECELQLRQQSAAIVSLKGAEAEAFRQAKPELAEDPIATIFLLQKSVAFQYTPRLAVTSPPSPTAAGGRPNRPIPLLDRTRRGEAFGALLVDEFPAVQRQVTAAATAKTLPPVLEAAKSAGILHALEYAQTRDTVQTAALAHAVASKASALLDQALIDASTQVSAIEESAQQIVIASNTVMNQATNQPFTYQQTRRRGLSQKNIEYLRGVKAACDQISAAAREIRQALGCETETMEVSSAKAEAMKLRVNDLFHDDYSKVPTQ